MRMRDAHVLLPHSEGKDEKIVRESGFESRSSTRFWYIDYGFMVDSINFRVNHIMNQLSQEKEKVKSEMSGKCQIVKSMIATPLSGCSSSSTLRGGHS